MSGLEPILQHEHMLTSVRFLATLLIIEIPILPEFPAGMLQSVYYCSDFTVNSVPQVDLDEA
jgi:hypothetical protein